MTDLVMGEVRDYLLDQADAQSSKGTKPARGGSAFGGRVGTKRAVVGIGRKAWGKMVRQEYLQSLREQGILLDQQATVWARARTGLWVALPASSESGRGAWFLGLKESLVLERLSNGEVGLVLLCQPKSGSMIDFVIPPQKTREIAPSLPKSKGELKFNIGSDYRLGLNGREPLDLSPYIHMVNVFRGSTRGL
ncbi:MAG: hypothetical protein Q7R39_07595 [Dehalococcoidia bacterium]|nr:hypothetical protein [Dehalococcoidia bacterium]